MMTGRIRFRTTFWRQKQVLQVERREMVFHSGHDFGHRRVWRDATLDEAFEICEQAAKIMTRSGE